MLECTSIAQELLILEQIAMRWSKRNAESSFWIDSYETNLIFSISLNLIHRIELKLIENMRLGVDFLILESIVMVQKFYKLLQTGLINYIKLISIFIQQCLEVDARRA